MAHNNVCQLIFNSLRLVWNWCLYTFWQDFENISNTYGFNTYAMDAVMTLALALNATVGDFSETNLSLSDAIEATTFMGSSVSLDYWPEYLMITIMVV